MCVHSVPGSTTGKTCEDVVVAKDSLRRKGYVVKARVLLVVSALVLLVLAQFASAPTRGGSDCFT